MNFNQDIEATLRYEPADFTVLLPGKFVTCAISGKKIPLSQLKYWNVDRQEAYASAEEAYKAFLKYEASAS